MKITNRINLVLGLALSACVSTASASNTLSLKIGPLGSSGGQLDIGLYQEGQDYPSPSEKVYRRVKVKVDAARIQDGHYFYEFESVPDGEYAVAVVHDLNANDKLDKSFIGIPKEPYGFSNNPKPLMRPARFDEAVFVLDQSKLIEIEL